MKLSASFLSMKENRIKELCETDIDYLHVDVMDGEFTPETTMLFDSMKSILSDIDRKLDVHLMVKDVKKYIDLYATLKPSFITIHYEVIKDNLEIIDYIKSMNIKVGLAINPGTPVDAILTYLDKIDMVLVMSVIPGRGGQSFISSSTSKVKRLKFLKDINNFNYLIEIDGGINNEVIEKITDVDIVVIGSYITSSNNYLEQVSNIKEELFLHN